jgi:serine/threonine protein kinase/Tol biopolymer transport system component
MQDFTGKDLGRYHIIEQLGQGGMAQVYRALDTRLQVDVAIKILLTDVFSAQQLEEVLNRFEREARALARLSHPNIVKVTDYGEYEQLPYFVMEYFPGGSLKRLLEKPIPFDVAAKILVPVAEALEYAHQNGIIHRDVKPANMLITRTGSLMLADFGVAKLLDHTGGQTLTGSSVSIGTPEYMAPEQAVASSVDHRADIYSLGVTYFEMVTGQRPFSADAPMAVVLKHISDPLPSPSTIIPGLPRMAEQVIFKALAKQPGDRYQTMSEFAEALTRMGSTAGNSAIQRLIQQASSANDVQDPVVLFPPGETPSAPKIGTILRRVPRKTLLYGSIVIVVLAMSLAAWIGMAKPARSPAIPTRLSAAQATPLTMDTAITVVTIAAPTGTPSVAPSAIPSAIPSVIPSVTPTAAAPTPTLTSAAAIPTIATSNADPTGSPTLAASDELLLVTPTGAPEKKPAALQLTNGRGDDVQPFIASSGEEILFISTRNGNQEIYRMNFDGSDQQRLTETEAIDESLPSYSPDGTQILFGASWGPNDELNLMKPDGSATIDLTNTPAIHEGRARYMPGRPASIVYDSTQSGKWDIYTGEIYDNQMSDVTRITSDPVYLYRFPSFIPALDAFVFRREKIGLGALSSRIVTHFLADGSEKIISKDESAIYPLPSPDGKWIFYLSSRGGKSELFRIRTQDGSISKIVAGDFDISSFAISPDMHWLIISARHKDAYYHLYRIPFP